MKHFDSDVVGGPWWAELRPALEALFDKFRASRLALKPSAGAAATPRGELDIARIVRQTLGHESRRPAPPWSFTTAAERGAFKQDHGQELDEVVRQAFPAAYPSATPTDAGSLTEEDDGAAKPNAEATRALLRLIGWDLRCLWLPPVQVALRRAQIADDRVFLQRVGEAVVRNERWRRDARGTRFLSELLLQFRFGDPDAFRDTDYKNKVREDLCCAFAEAGVPEDHQSLNLLMTPAHFDRHLRRIGALRATAKKGKKTKT